MLDIILILLFLNSEEYVYLKRNSLFLKEIAIKKKTCLVDERQDFSNLIILC